MPINIAKKITASMPEKWWIFISVASANIMSTLDASIVNIALPVIRADFKVEIVQIEWVVVAYLLTISALLMLFGRLADIFGRKRLYTLGIALFVIGSLLCAVSGSLTLLTASRILQGIGASCIMANGLAIVTAVFPPQERGKVIGLIGTTVAIGLSAGPMIGGIMTSLFGWRSIFLINLPVGIFAYYLTGKFLKESEIHKGVKFDFIGAALMTLAMLIFLYAFTEYQQIGLTLFITLVIASLALIIVFYRVEAVEAHPMLDMKMMKSPFFYYPNLTSFLFFLGRSSVIFLFPFYLVDLRKFAPSTAGLLMTPIPLLMAAIAPFSGSLSDKIGARFLTTFGLMLTVLGSVMFMFLSESTSIPVILAALVLMGVGSGIFSSPNTSSIMGSVPKEKLGIAGATAALVRNLGMIMGIAWSGMLFHAIIGKINYESSPQIIVPAFSAVMKVSVIITLIAVMISYKRMELPRHSPAKAS